MSVVFLSSFIGYATAAVANHWIHVRFGQRGIAFLGCSLHILAYLAITQHPPYAVLVGIFVLAGLGNGVIDASWNAWIGAMADSSKLMGLLHAFYGLGAALAPLIATSLFTKRGWQWYEFYYIMAAAAAVEFATSVTVFWNAGPLEEHQPEQVSDSPDESNGSSSPTVQAMKIPSTWIISAFLFAYVGSEVTIGGWLQTFLIDLRQAPRFASGIVNFVYWAGLTGGRVALGFLTPYLKQNQRFAVTTYLTACIVMQLVFCLVDNIVASAIAVSFLGFFLGPLFPEAVIAQTRILPKNLHVAAVGFASALGSAGGCTFPFLTGAIAKWQGIGVLQPMVLAILVVCLGLWLMLPAPPRMPAGRRDAV